MTEKDKENINSQETYKLLQMIRIPTQKEEHPDFWIKESITQLLEEELDHPTTSKYFHDITQNTQRTSKPEQKNTPGKYLPTSHQMTSLKVLKHGKR